MRYPGFIGPAYRTQSEFADGEDLINWYIEQMESPAAKNKLALYPAPGFALRTRVTAAPGRGLFAENDRVFAVVGPKLVEVTSTFGLIDRGTVLQDTAPATLTTNGAGGGQLMITSGGKVYIYDLVAGGALTTIADLTSLMGGMIDGYFIALDTTTSKLRISNLLDGLTWDPTQFAQRSTASDPWRSFLVSNQRLYIFGERTSEVWYDAGNFPFPFAPIQGGVIPYGIAAPFSAAEYQGNPVWLAQNKSGDRMIMRATGYSTADRISTHALEFAMRQYEVVADAEAVVYQEDGHPFYVLNFPTVNATWVYDDEGSWHKRGFWNTKMMRFETWRPRAHAFAFGTHLVVDRVGGGLYAMSNAYGREMDGGPLRRVRRTPALYNEGRRLRVAGVILALETGIAPSTGQGSAPLVGLRKSKDGGHTWGNERLRSAGRLGEYDYSVHWNRCGSGFNIAFEISVSDPIPWRITDAFLRMPGEHP
jgi:hypothetical protein